MTFWTGMLIYVMGVLTLPAAIVLSAWLLARYADRRQREERMSAEWLRARKDRGRPISEGAEDWLKEHERGFRKERARALEKIREGRAQVERGLGIRPRKRDDGGGKHGVH
ncbi:MAG: hypothetical protein GY769_07765 [bacterium]|nr:hypothetical protein [bacterium]